jgi:hypothetical protein
MMVEQFRRQLTGLFVFINKGGKYGFQFPDPASQVEGTDNLPFSAASHHIKMMHLTIIPDHANKIDLTIYAINVVKGK